MKKFLLGIFLIVLVSASLYFLKDYIGTNNTNKNEDNNKNYLGYSETSYKKIIDLEIDVKSYSKTLEKVLETDNYIDEYLDDYLNINYIENEYFTEKVNSLLTKKYTHKKINELSFIFESKYYKDEYLDRYIAYYNKNSSLKDSIVIYVNIGLDKDFYTNIKEIKNPDDTLVIVNKYNKLADNYETSNLVTIEKKYLAYNRTTKLKKVASDALISMIKQINSEGMNMWLISGHRTKSYQNTLFTNSTKKNGINHALIYSAKPRHSEHETGLAADISSVKGMLNGFEKYKEYTWLKENAYKYGFIERYPKDKENITGYAYEPWHWRYVGIEAATIIKNEGITFEEYHVKYLNY